MPEVQQVFQSETAILGERMSEVSVILVGDLKADLSTG